MRSSRSRWWILVGVAIFLAMLAVWLLQFT